MRNLVQDGLVVPLVAPKPILPGEIVNVGSIVGVAVGPALQGEVVQTRLEGVFENLPAANGIAAGTVVYFNPATGSLATTASGNVKCGVSLGNGRVRLNGAAV